MNSNLEKAYRLACLMGLYRIAARMREAVIAPSPQGTAHTDGSAIVIDPVFLEKLSAKDLLFIMAHEYYHIIYDHTRRMREKNLTAVAQTGSGQKVMLYNIAADLVINEHLLEIGLKKPDDTIAGVFRDNPMFKDLPDDCDTSEKIYAWLLKNTPSADEAEQAEMGDIGHDEKDADSDPADAARNQMDRELEKHSPSKGFGKKEIFEATASELPKEKVSWIDLLTAMRIESGRLVKREIIHNYMRPSRREEPKGIILASNRHTVAMPKVDVYVDVSGSMYEAPLTIMAGLKSILSAMAIYRPRFYAFNEDITRIDMQSNGFAIGGGTDIKKVLGKITDDRADLAIVITDCQDNVSRKDFKRNIVIVSDNAAMADFYTTDWKKVRVNHA